MITVHQSVGEAKEQFYFERTVFLRCVASSNPPVHYTWRRGREALTQGSDSGVEIYEPFFTQVSKHTSSFYQHRSQRASPAHADLLCRDLFISPNWTEVSFQYLYWDYWDFLPVLSSTAEPAYQIEVEVV